MASNIKNITFRQSGVSWELNIRGIPVNKGQSINGLARIDGRKFGPLKNTISEVKSIFAPFNVFNGTPNISTEKQDMFFYGQMDHLTYNFTSSAMVANLIGAEIFGQEYLNNLDNEERIFKFPIRAMQMSRDRYDLLKFICEEIQSNLPIYFTKIKTQKSPFNRKSFNRKFLDFPEELKKEALKCGTFYFLDKTRIYMI